LEDLNRQRQKLAFETSERAREIGERDRLSGFLLFAVSSDFHEGVVGLAASRLAEEFYRPAFVARTDGNLIKASARSIPEFDIAQALDQCAGLLVKHGGHRQAAGFSLKPANLPEFTERLDAIARDSLAEQDLRPRQPLAAQLGFGDLSDELMDFIEMLEPSGQGNPYPVFASERAVVLSKRAVGVQKRHLKLSFRESDRMFDAIAFNFGDRLESLPRVVDVAYRLERNEFRGVVSLQLNVQDLRASRD
jgi:single-stranded-DNA-specific exonuclease